MQAWQDWRGRVEAMMGPGSSAGRSRGWRVSRYLLRLSRLVWFKLGEDQAQDKAAALTYHTLFSLLPTLVLMLVIAKAFVSDEDLTYFKDQTVQWVTQWVQQDAAEEMPVLGRFIPSGAEGGAGDGLASGLPGPLGSGFGLTFDPVALQVEAAVLVAAERERRDRRSELREVLGTLDQRITALLNYLESVDMRSIGVVGVLLFIYGATQLLASIEQNFNGIIQARGHRPLRTRVPLYFTTITLAPVVLGAGRWAQQEFEALLEASQWTDWIAALASNFWPLITTWLVLLVLYRLLPNARLAMRGAAAGSLVAAVLLSIATLGFGVYASNTAISSLYGALTLLPLTLLMIWTAWLIVLFGFELGVCVQMLPRYQRDFARRQERRVTHLTRAGIDGVRRLVEPRRLLTVMAYAADRFRTGKPFTVDDLMEDLVMPPEAAAGMVEALLDEGLLLSLGAEEDPRFALAMPPEHVAVQRLLEVVDRMTGPAATDPVLSRLRDAERAGAEGVTLAALVPAPGK